MHFFENWIFSSKLFKKDITFELTLFLEIEAEVYQQLAVHSSKMQIFVMCELKPLFI